MNTYHIEFNRLAWGKRGYWSPVVSLYSRISDQKTIAVIRGGDEIPVHEIK